MKLPLIISLAVISLAFIASIYFYPLFPNIIASHWNAQGDVNGYMGKFWGLFLMPILSVFLLLLFLLIPKIDPLKENVIQFRKYFDWFIAILLLFLFYLHLLTISWNLGYKFNMIRALIPGFGILFYYIGILTENSKRNWFIGIRTPWTLSSEIVWNKTHKLGGTLFKISGIIALLGLFLPKLALIFILAPIILTSLYSIIYSYFAFHKLVLTK